MLHNWRKYFPYSKARPIQEQVMDVIANNWDKYSIFVVKAPTSFGKSSIAKTLMRTLNSVSLITPTNLLVKQFTDEFPDTCTLSRLDSYVCEEWQRPCPVTRGKLLQFCKGCPASKDLATAKYHKGPGIYNYHTYLAHKLYRSVLVIDEAHNVLPLIRDRLAVTLWQHDYKYPHNMYRPEQIDQWVRTLPLNKQRHAKVQLLLDSVCGRNPTHIFQRTTMAFAGKGTIRGQPEMRECIRLLPVDIKDAPPMLWPREVEKIVLLSATIGPKDIEQLGMGGGSARKVCYIDCDSPIPAASRPIIFDPVISVNRNNMEESVRKIASYILQIAEDRPQEKGVIHATYQMASMLRAHLLPGGRFMYHTRDSKTDIYNQFRSSPAKSGAVLIASGMYEGIDLPEDLGRWQVISKIPWLSLGDPAVAHLAAKDPDYYLWETIKSTIQACGRICRTENDYGITYILDGSFARILDEGDKFLPQWYKDAIICW